MQFKHLAFCLLLTMICFSTNLFAQFDGYALYNSQGSNTTYLIDADGDIAHRWNLDRPCNYTVLLKEDGNLMRGAIAPNVILNGPAVGGMVQEIDPDGNVIWEFTYNSSSYVAHHDLTLMPNNGVLITAWEVKSAAEMQAMGYEDNASKYPTHFIEVQPDGNGGGEIVWEWHIFDHLIQDVDPNKPNFGVVSDHPELLDINVATTGSSGGGPGGGGPGGGGGGNNNSGDWMHTNGIDYNEELDQIAFSCRYLSEVFIIDHSTTTEEAAGHTGGNSGKGGDFLYRWGNPSNYGYDGPQLIDGPVHDVRFIPDDGRPRGGYLHFFNNEGPTGNGSQVDALELPRSADGYNYDLTSNDGYAPASPSWTHLCNDDANGQSAANSMPNGNVFVNLSGSYMYEADENGNIIWQYANDSQKAFRYTCDYPGIQALLSQGVLEENFCMLTSINDLAGSEKIMISPNPSTGIFQLTGSLEHIRQIEIIDMLGRTIQNHSNGTPELNISNNLNGIYFVKILFNDQSFTTQKISLLK